MGMVFGKITVETPKYEVVHSAADYEIRQYPPCVVAEVSYNPKDMRRGDKDGGFMMLANYIGALGNPQNSRPEKIAMTAPVITTEKASEAGGEKIAMTAPVITTSKASETGEAIAMTAPVVTTTTTTAAPEDATVTMRFILPSKYTSASDAPRPTDAQVVVRDEAGKRYGVVRFSGVATDKVVEQKVSGLKAALERDGHRLVPTPQGEAGFLLARYNPPWTIPRLRTNEVMVPVEVE